MESTALAEKTALVIGASSGIGLATANIFADVGATVHAAARRRETIREGAGGRHLEAHELDISDREAVWRVVEEIGESDGIDILVVAAGMNFPERRRDGGPTPLVLPTRLRRPGWSSSRTPPVSRNT
jgi:NAD(P)-dependent dehydrogenase (short-subunit alcohol dehydrogenase family)